MIEGNPADTKKERYFSKFGNWVSLLTLLFVAAYTVITFIQWRSNHIFNKKQLRFIDSQLSEMHRASLDTAQLVKTARETEELQLRAYVGVVGNVTLKCPLCDTADIDRPIEIPREHLLDNIITFTIQNGGQTPAYDVVIEEGDWQVGFGQCLPKT